MLSAVPVCFVTIKKIKIKNTNRIPIAKPPLDIFKTSITSQGQTNFQPMCTYYERGL
jgi:hypothetical protein